MHNTYLETHPLHGKLNGEISIFERIVNAYHKKQFAFQKNENVQDNVIGMYIDQSYFKSGCIVIRLPSVLTSFS